MNRAPGRSISLIGLILLLAAALNGGEEPARPEQTRPERTQRGTTPPSIAAPDREGEHFFEKHIRPVLVEHCLRCHGPHKQQGGLRLDSPVELRKGGDGGAVVVPGDPDQSRLIQAIRYQGTLRMPRKGKLPDPVVQTLTAWVKMGVPWPEAPGTDPGSVDRRRAQAGQTHWAFQPVPKPDLPLLKESAGLATPIDVYLRARLKEKGLTASPPADRRTLLRRATFDLHGLPPTPEEVEAFEADRSADAFARVVERLLASPRYGERWGRHWLDVARYADTKGYVRLQENPRFCCAWTYRDYVIRAFQEDVPYDRFILEQLAADRLPLGEDRRPLAALGFLTAGPRFLNSQPEIIDDRIDVVTRGFLGLSVSCARCHDHKFDPVPQKDYYSLYGVFASSMEPRVPPLIALASEHARHAAYLKELHARTAKFEGYLQDQHARLTADFRARAGDYLLAAQKEPLQANFNAVMFLVDAARELNPAMVQRWKRFLEQHEKTGHPVLEPWYALAALPPGAFAARAPEVLAGLTQKEGTRRVNPVVLRALSAAPPRTLAETARCYGELFREAERRWREARQRSPELRRLDDPDWEALRQWLYGPDAPPDVPLQEIEDYFFVDATVQNRFHEQQRRVEDWIASPGAAPHALALEDAPVPVEPHVFIRGNSSNPGPAVPRQFLAVLSRGERQPFRTGSGRLELARAIARRENPLTARVLVNRVWAWHFGQGLVRTPSDFGLRGEPPTHPELLDWLAWQFMEDGWSFKQLHRRIMLSAAYQQASTDTPAGREKDPENTLWWKMNRRRLDWESLRDALLAVAGTLDLTPGGPPVDLVTAPFSTRRTVYGLIDRQNLPGVFRTFDFAVPDASSPQRHQTTVPQQALFLMNSPFLREQARRLASRADLLGPKTADGRIDLLYRRLFGRVPEPEERVLARKYLEHVPAAHAVGNRSHLNPWEEYVQVLLLTNEFATVD